MAGEKSPSHSTASAAGAVAAAIKQPHGETVLGVPLQKSAANKTHANAYVAKSANKRALHGSSPVRPLMDYGHRAIPNNLYYVIVLASCLATIITGSAYLCWKAIKILPNISASGYTAVLFLIVELVCFVSGPIILAIEVAAVPRKRKLLTLGETDQHPSVSIFVCCCREPLDVIQDTVKGAVNQKYPSDRYTVWVLDDGEDDGLKSWVEGFAEHGSCKLKYVRRQKYKSLPHHYKAGNINWGLHLAKSEYVTVLDADMILSPYYLICMLPHFDADVAFVQCPQSFYNLVPGDPLNDSSDNFYDVLLPYRDGRDAAQCVGTGVMIKKACLRENNGISIGSITEDFNTALSFHSRGYKSVYVNQRLQAGLAPWNLEDYVEQHQRWLTGNLQILFLRHPLFVSDRRFSLYSRFSYWYSGAQYFISIFVLMLIILPIAILLFDLRIMPLHSEVEFSQRLYIILLVPYILCSKICTLCLYSRIKQSTRVQIRAEQVWYWMAYFNVVGILKFALPWAEKSFRVTGSEKGENYPKNSFLTVWFHIAYCAVGVFTLFRIFYVLDFRDCGKVYRASSWAAFIVFCMVNMMVPVIYCSFWSDHPKMKDRKKLLNYDDYGFPYLRPEQLVPLSDWRTNLYNVIPMLCVAVLGFYFYAALTNYRLPFCSEGFFDNAII